MSDMDEIGYYCYKCGHNHKWSSRIGQRHKPVIEETGEPGPEEVSPESDPGRGLFSLIEPTTAPAVQEPGEAEISLRSTQPPAPSMEEMFAHILKQIDTLSQNDQVIAQRLDQIQSNEYEAIQTAEGASWSFDEFPDWLREPAVKFLGDIGAAARGLAGGAPAEQPEDVQIITQAVTIMRENANQRIAAKAAQIAQAMEDPNLEVFSRAKKDE